MEDTSKPLPPEFFINPQCPLGVVPTTAASIDAHPGEMTNAPGMEAHATVLETNNDEASEHLIAAEAGRGN